MQLGRYLRRFDPDRTKPTRALDLDVNPPRELDPDALARCALKESDYRRGWYTRTIDGQLVGYCATEEGPVLFLGARAFPLDPARQTLRFETLGGFPDHVDDPLEVRITLAAEEPPCSSSEAGARTEETTEVVSFVCRGLVKTFDDWSLDDEPEDLFHDLRREMAEPGFRTLMTLPTGLQRPPLAALGTGLPSDEVLEVVVQVLRVFAVIAGGFVVLALGLWVLGWA